MRSRIETPTSKAEDENEDEDEDDEDRGIRAKMEVPAAG